MSETARLIIYWGAMGSLFAAYGFIAIYGLIYMDPDRVKRRKKKLKEKKKLAKLALADR